MMISVFFAWYDFWVGAYWDRSARVLYVCPLPCVVIRLQMCPRAWPDPFAPTTPPALAWPAWLAFAALVMAVGLVELVADSVRGAWLAARTRAALSLIEVGMRVGPQPPMREGVRQDPVWRVVTCPKGSAAVLSDREPGPMVGQPGQLERWQDAGEGERERGLTFEVACAEMARRNGKPSTANMDDRSGAT